MISGPSSVILVTALAFGGDVHEYLDELGKAKNKLGFSSYMKLPPSSKLDLSECDFSPAS